MELEIRIRCETRLPARVVGSVDVSLPHGDRLLALNRWAQLDLDPLTQAIQSAGWELAQWRPDRRQAAIADLHGRLRTVETDAVWLIPGAVEAKLSYQQHLAPFCRKPARALIATGLRDSYQNMYKWVYRGGAEPVTYCRAAEPLAGRSYTLLYQPEDEPWRLYGGRGSFVGRRLAIAGDPRPVRFAIASTPLVEAGQEVDDVRRIGQQADLRHEFRLGKDPQRLRELQAILLSEVDPEVGGDRVLAAARQLGLEEEDGYFLSGIGVTAAGDVILLSTHGHTRDLARQLVEAGAEYALLQEEGGSCATLVQQLARDFSPGGGPQLDDSGQPIWGPPVRFGNNTYHRDLALAVLVFSLNNDVLERPFR